MGNVKQKEREEIKDDEIKKDEQNRRLKIIYEELRREGLNHLEAMDKAKRTMACFKGGG
jgi:hypothetical protein